MRPLLSSRTMSSFWVTVTLVATLNSPPPQQPGPAQPAQPAATSAAAPPNPFVNLLPNLGKDFQSLVSLNSAVVLGVGGASAVAAHNNDESVRDWAAARPKDPHLAKA